MHDRISNYSPPGITKETHGIDDDGHEDDSLPPAKHHKAFFSVNDSDEFMVFGVHVAHELKKIQSEYLLQLAKHKINKILFDATTNHLDKSLI